MVPLGIAGGYSRFGRDPRSFPGSLCKRLIQNGFPTEKQNFQLPEKLEKISAKNSGSWKTRKRFAEGFWETGKPAKDFFEVAGFPEKLEKIIFVFPGSAGVRKTFVPDFLVPREVEFYF